MTNFLESDKARRHLAAQFLGQIAGKFCQHNFSGQIVGKFRQKAPFVILLVIWPVLDRKYWVTWFLVHLRVSQNNLDEILIYNEHIILLKFSPTWQ